MENKVEAQTITTNAAECRAKLAPVYCRYPGQTQPQSAYIELDPAKHTLRADYNGEIGSAVPVTVWHGHQYRLSVTPYLTGEALADLMEDAKLLALAAEVCDGHSIEWDGSNRVGRLTEDARLALDELERYLHEHGTGINPDTLITVYEPSDWVQDDSQVDITAETTDEQLAEMAAEMVADAELEHVLIEDGVSDMLDWLTELRGRLREDAQ